MLKKALDSVEKALMVLMGILTAVMVAVVFYQVVLRYAFSSANAWADELSRYALIWVVMLAAPVGFRRYRHIRIDVFIRRVPRKPRKVIELIIYLLEIAFLVVMLCSGVSIGEKVMGQSSVGLGLPAPIMYASVAIGSGLSIIFVLENMYNEFIVPLIKARKSKEAVQ